MISTSPERGKFTTERYLARKAQEGKTPANSAEVQAMIQFVETDRERDLRQMDDPEWQINNLEYDLRSTDWMLEKARSRDSYAQHIYAALCNNDFQKLDVIEVLKNNTWSCSWRYAGGIVAHMRESGDYIDWYCSGMGDGLGNGDADRTKGYVGEGCITEEILTDFKKIDWIPVPGGAWDNY
jgi:hypothetical protein